jgi:hypothetical protein
MVYCEIEPFLLLSSATYRKRPFGLATIAYGTPEPLTDAVPSGLSTPPPPIENSEILLLEFVTKTAWPEVALAPSADPALTMTALKMSAAAGTATPRRLH